MESLRNHTESPYTIDTSLAEKYYAHRQPSSFDSYNEDLQRISIDEPGLSNHAGIRYSCPQVHCIYSSRGFHSIRGYKKHALEHYLGDTVVCGFCSELISPQRKSFSEAYFKDHLRFGHLTRTKFWGASNHKLNSRCPICNIKVSTPQALSDHLDSCVLQSLSQDDSVLIQIENEVLDFLTCANHLKARVTLAAGVLNEIVHFNITVIVNWDLESYLESSCELKKRRIGSSVALTGSVEHAQATTISTYMQEMWPLSGPFVLGALQSAIDGCDQQHYMNGLGLDILVNADIPPGQNTNTPCIVKAFGKTGLLVELVQALGWLGSATGLRPSKDNVEYRTPSIASYHIGGGILFDLTFRSVPLRPQEKSCWLPLFDGACIARGFPISKRPAGEGLEVPIEIMAAVVGAQGAFEYQGGIVIKGYSNMLVPIHKRADTVQWHLFSSSNCTSRMTYSEVLIQCPHRALISEVGFATLQTTRAVLGWCTRVSSSLGSFSADYKSIHYSTAKEATRETRLGGFSFGFQQFGMAQLDFSLSPKVGKYHIQQSGPYQSIIRAAGNMPVVLYDTAAKRAFLVSAASVILHMVRLRDATEPFEIDPSLTALFRCSDAQMPAIQLLLDLADMSILRNEEYTLKTLVMSQWSRIEYLVDQEETRSREAGSRISLTAQKNICGFEFKAIVEERPLLSRKQAVISRTSGGWPSLVRDINALVLFASGYGDILKTESSPNNEKRLCVRWRNLPSSKDYLAATVEILKDLYRSAGYAEDQTYLTPTRLRWHRGSSKLFESCHEPDKQECCDRLQKIVPKRAVGSIIPPGELLDDGAVIFGRSLSSWRNVLGRIKQLASL